MRHTATDPDEHLRRLRDDKAEQRRRAAADGRPYAKPIDLDVTMDVGAPVPHVVTNGSVTIVVFHVGLPTDPTWDGKTITVVDPSLPETYDLGWVKFSGVAATLLGPPNDEAISGHPLWNAGLEPYCFHIVENSQWRADYATRNQVHPHHKTETVEPPKPLPLHLPRPSLRMPRH